MSTIRSPLAAIACLLASAALCRADCSDRETVILQRSGTRIGELTLEDSADLVTVGPPGDLHVAALVRGTLDRPGWELWYKEQRVVTAAREASDTGTGPRKFKLLLALAGPRSEAPFELRSPPVPGRPDSARLPKETEKVVIELKSIRDWAPRYVYCHSQLRTRPVWLSAGLRYLHYKESRIADFKSITPLIGVGTELELGSRNWVAEGAIDFTPLASGSTLDGDGHGARFIGSDIALRHVFSEVRMPWLVSVSAGFAYRQIWVDGAAYGFDQIIAPEATLRAGRQLGPTDAVLASASISSQDNEFRLGVEWRFQARKQTSAVALAFSTADFSQSLGRDLSRKSVSLGFRQGLL